MSWDIAGGFEVTTKTTSKWFDVPMVEGSGFQIELLSVSREGFQKIAKRNTHRAWDKKLRAFTENLDEDRYFADIAKTVIKGWRGLNIGILKALVTVETEAPDTTEVPYSTKNCINLLKGVVGFDQWIADTISLAVNFLDQDDEDEKAKLEGNFSATENGS